MASKKEALSHFALLFLRLSVGVQLAAFHGWDKYQAYAQRVATFPDPLTIGHKNSLVGTVVAELACGALLALGAMGRVMALVVGFSLTLTLFWHQTGDSWRRRETTVLYLAASVVLLIFGPGKYSLDGYVRGRKGGAGKGAGPAKNADPK